MIRFRHVNFSYHSPDEESKELILKDINISIEKGECVLFTGASGCGKSTLLLLINGIIPEFTHGTVDGDILLQNRRADTLSIAERSMLVGSVFQNPKSQFFHLNTSDEICFGAANHRVPIEKIKDRFNDTVALFSIEDLMNRNILQLSGGEKQQIACASVTMSQPSIYLLDEPSSNLDPESIKKLKTILLELKKLGNTILIAEHRLYYALEVCDRVIYMQKGRIVFDQGKEEFMNQCDQKAHGLRSFYANSIDKLWKGCYEEVEGKIEDSICINEMLVTYPNKVAVDITDLELPKHKVVAIVGGNGAGKSSFVRALVGIDKTKHFILNGKKAKKNDCIKQSYMVMQDVNCQLYSESVLDELVDLTEETDEEIAKAKEILTKLHLIDFVESHPLALSGGQKQRLAIACALFLDKKILVFDEPTSGLDYKNMLNVSLILKDLKEKVDCLIVITHDIELIEQCADYILEIHQGRVKRQLIKNEEEIKWKQKIPYSAYGN
jgi:energy-coupling factor transport system ATP-binding protein